MRGRTRATVVAAAALLGFAITAAWAAGSPTDPTQLPIGDGKVTTSGAKRGYVYRCRIGGGGGGAFRDGPWIKSDGTYDLTTKAIVDGAVTWPGAISIKVRGSRLAITGNGLPRGATSGIYPVQTTDDAFQYDRNPNSIRAQTIAYSLPAKPKIAAKPGCLTGGAIGITVNGVVFFDGLDTLNRDAVAHEVQDACGGHPERTGTYHYHSISECLTKGASTKAHSSLAGYALDGFPIYGPRGTGGALLSNARLDVCHGHAHVVTLRGKRVQTYHYHATLEYPYTLGCFRGAR
jgi:hypothetical protein